ncbi:hypothetical protein F5Y01DRAFT_319797 [Xylaria sp. FL0043]|nr:hypothetical protein F5Y01DRAFT_319797 [Xylaria sp. FL0043]
MYPRFSTLAVLVISFIVLAFLYQRWPCPDGKYSPPGARTAAHAHAAQLATDIYLQRLHRDVTIVKQDPRADLYSYLGLAHRASIEQIREAYQVMYRRLSEKAASVAELSVLGDVFHALISPQLRARYDQMLQAEGHLFEF